MYYTYSTFHSLNSSKQGIQLRVLNKLLLIEQFKNPLLLYLSKFDFFQLISHVRLSK